jgi:hypothetical protein
MPGTWVCRIGAVVGALVGLGAAIVVGYEIAGKLLDLGMVDDTRAWRIALTFPSGIVGALLGGGSVLAGSGCRGRDPADRGKRRIIAIAWLLILVGAAITPIGDFLAWAGVAAWVTGLALQVSAIVRARGKRSPHHLR